MKGLPIISPPLTDKEIALIDSIRDSGEDSLRWNFMTGVSLRKLVVVNDLQVPKVVYVYLPQLP